MTPSLLSALERAFPEKRRAKLSEALQSVYAQVGTLRLHGDGYHPMGGEDLLSGRELQLLIDALGSLLARAGDALGGEKLCHVLVANKNEELGQIERDYCHQALPCTRHTRDDEATPCPAHPSTPQGDTEQAAEGSWTGDGSKARPINLTHRCDLWQPRYVHRRLRGPHRQA